MKISYETKRFSADHMALIEYADQVIVAYAEQGYDLTLRQLYYRFVTANLIVNEEASYKRLGTIISAGRRAGLLDWDAITDRTRNLEKLSTWETPQELMTGAAEQFRFDRWENQPCYVEVWFEKDALMGVFERISNELRVPFFSCRGYTSDSEIWRAAQRLGIQEQIGKQVVVLHFGDHDPSGLDMTRDIRDRLDLFEAGNIEVRRLALNMDQVRHYKPAPNPAKAVDPRFRGYRREHGNSSWELDALEPAVLVGLVRREVESFIDDYLWRDEVKRENQARSELHAIAENYPRVVKRLNTGK